MAIERLKSAERNIKTDSKPFKIAQKCSKMLKNAQNSLKLYKIALFYYCFYLPGSKIQISKLLKNAQKMLKIAQNCSKSRNQVSTIDSQVAIIIN